VETHVRSIAKAMTWRAGGLAVTFGVAWAITGRLDLAVSLGAVDTTVKLFAFYVHERAWQKVKFGQSRPPDYDI
jgi:uncharacterized membrane protein